jgi:hypothetical protein
MYREDTIYSRGKVVEDREMDVRRYIIANEISGEGVLLRFRQRLLRLLETSTQMIMTAGEDFTKEGPTHNDFYGFFTSPHEILLGAAKRGLDPRGMVTCEVWTTIEDRLVASRNDDEGRDFSLRDKYGPVPRDWIIVGEGLNSDENIERWASLPWDARFDISPKRIDDRTDDKILIWTSVNDAVENRKLYEDILTRFVNMGALTNDENGPMLVKYDEEMSVAAV